MVSIKEYVHVLLLYYHFFFTDGSFYFTLFGFPLIREPVINDVVCPQYAQNLSICSINTTNEFPCTSHDSDIFVSCVRCKEMPSL